MELLELRRRLDLCSPGSEGLSPLDRANKLRMSVSDITPVSLPDRCAPGSAAAGTEDDGEKMGVDKGRGEGGADDWLLSPLVMTVAETDGDTPPPRFGLVTGPELELLMASAEPPPLALAVVAPTGPRRGVAGALGLGEADSTTHMR